MERNRQIVEKDHLRIYPKTILGGSMQKKLMICFAAPVMLLVFLFSNINADTQQPVSQTALAGTGSSIRSQIDAINQQIKSLEDELKGLYSQKEQLKDQLSVLRVQKHITGLNKRSGDLNAKLSDVQKKNSSEKTAEISGKISLVTKELAIQQEILALYNRLADAHKAGQKDAAATIDASIRSKREEIKALYPPKPAQAATPAPSANPVNTPKPEDADIQALVDQIKAIDAQIAVDKAKVGDLKAQKETLKAQLKKS
jgi:chromosome segregation ATPase